MFRSTIYATTALMTVLQLALGMEESSKESSSSEIFRKETKDFLGIELPKDSFGREVKGPEECRFTENGSNSLSKGDKARIAKSFFGSLYSHLNQDQEAYLHLAYNPHWSEGSGCGDQSKCEEERKAFEKLGLVSFDPLAEANKRIQQEGLTLGAKTSREALLKTFLASEEPNCIKLMEEVGLKKELRRDLRHFVKCTLDVSAPSTLEKLRDNVGNVLDNLVQVDYRYQVRRNHNKLNSFTWSKYPELLKLNELNGVILLFRLVQIELMRLTCKDPKSLLDLMTVPPRILPEDFKTFLTGEKPIPTSYFYSIEEGKLVKGKAKYQTYPRFEAPPSAITVKRLTEWLEYDIMNNRFVCSSGKSRLLTQAPTDMLPANNAIEFPYDLELDGELNGKAVSVYSASYKGKGSTYNFRFIVYQSSPNSPLEAFPDLKESLMVRYQSKPLEMYEQPNYHG